MTQEFTYSKHFDGKRFYNPASAQARGLLDFLRWKLATRPDPSPAFIDDVISSIPPRRIENDKLRATFINHSSLLLQQRTANILTDPIWSERATPFHSIGPRRHRAPGVRKEDLPPIDILLLSHNHYDHLDVPSLRWLTEQGQFLTVVPMGVAALLQSLGLRNIVQLDWGDSHVCGDTTIHCVPALHFSARGPFDRNRSLWCGYVIEAQDRTIYFAGDTGYGDHFQQIRDRFGPPSLSLLPVGAYEPRWFMSPIHMAPEEALRAHTILASPTSIAIHHGTFQLADDSVDQPITVLAELEAPKSFVVLNNGQSIQIE